MDLTLSESVFNKQKQIKTILETSYQVKRKENPTNRDTKTYSNGYKFHNHRLRLWYGGRCIDSSDGKKLTVQFCDPDLMQVRFG